jgi:hypothetical protein
MGTKSNHSVIFLGCSVQSTKKNYGPRGAAAHSGRLLARPLTVAHSCQQQQAVAGAAAHPSLGTACCFGWIRFDPFKLI